MITTKQKKPTTFTFTLALLFLVSFLATTPLARAIVWDSDIQLTASPGFWQLSPSAMQTRNGTSWVVFASDRYQEQFDLFGKIHNGSAWSNDINLISYGGKDEEPSIMQTHDGEAIWLVWSSDRTGNSEIFYQTSSDNGLSWGPTVQLTYDARHDNQPSIMQNLNGTIWIVWHRQVVPGNFDIFCKTSSDNGLSWSSEVRLTDHPSWDVGPSITHTENGTVFVVWASYRTGNFDLFYKTYSLSWSGEIPLTTNSNWDHNPSIIQDAAGTMWVFWQSDRNGDYKIYYKTSANYGASWTSDTPVITGSGDNESPSAVFRNDRKIWVFFDSSRTDDFEIWYKSSDPIPDIHDIAITGLLPWASRNVIPATWAPKGMPIYINVTVENQGSFDESFDVWVYADRDTGDIHIEIETQHVFLTAGSKTVLVFTWYTNTTPYGNYYLSAEATIHPSEYDIADNSLLKAARIGGIVVPWQEHRVSVLTLLVPPTLAALITTVLGIVVLALFKLLMSIRTRWPWRRSMNTRKTKHAT